MYKMSHSWRADVSHHEAKMQAKALLHRCNETPRPAAFSGDLLCPPEAALVQ
jgi:hypothetical protein